MQNHRESAVGLQRRGAGHGYQEWESELSLTFVMWSNFSR